MTHIPFFGVKRQYQTIKEELLEISDRVYSSGQVLDGEYTAEFETQIAKRCNRSYAVAVNSGTQALIFAQNAICNSKPVLIPTISFVATINSVLESNRDPVFCDVDFKGLIDLNAYQEKLDLTVGTVMYANLFGNCIDWERFQLQTSFFNDNLAVIEDAAQSFGAYYKDIPSGKMGDVSVLSFDPTKNLNNYGSGGMILTDDESIYTLLQGFRDNGKSMYHDVSGTNSKMSEVDCAQLLVKLQYFDWWQHRRKKIAEYYIDQLYQYVDILTPNEHVTHAWHKFVIRIHDRSSLQLKLSNHGIETKIHYEYALHNLGIGFPYIDHTKDQFPESSSFIKECLSLPIYPELTDGEVETIAAIIKSHYTDG